MTHQTLSLEKYWKLFPATLIPKLEDKTLFYIGKVCFSQRREQPLFCLPDWRFLKWLYRQKLIGRPVVHVLYRVMRRIPAFIIYVYIFIAKLHASIRCSVVFKTS